MIGWLLILAWAVVMALVLFAAFHPSGRWFVRPERRSVPGWRRTTFSEN